MLAGARGEIIIGRFRNHLPVLVALLSLSSIPVAFAGDAYDVPSAQPGTRTYAPYSTDDFPNRVYFGDTHLHTSY